MHRRRERLGLGLREMARLAYMCPGHVNDIEKGRKGLSNRAIPRLAEVLGCPGEASDWMYELQGRIPPRLRRRAA